MATVWPRTIQSSCFTPQARSKQCMIGPAEINIKLQVGGLGRAASPPAGSGAEPREPNAFQQKYNENGFKLLTIGGEQACCRTVALLYTPKSDCVVSEVKQNYWSVCYGPAPTAAALRKHC